MPLQEDHSHQHKKEEKTLFQGLTEISRAITEEKFLDDILSLIVSVTAEVTGSTICSILLLDTKHNELILRACQNESGCYSQRSNTPLGKGIAGRVAQQNRPISVRNVQTDSRFINKEVARNDDLISLLSVPMRVKDEVIGVINCYTSYEYEFSDKEIEMLTAVASQAAIVINNTQLRVLKELVEKELQERKTIERAKELLAHHKGISAKKAFELIRKKSMDTRTAMCKIAESICIAYEIE